MPRTECYIFSKRRSPPMPRSGLPLLNYGGARADTICLRGSTLMPCRWQGPMHAQSGLFVAH
eukprot:3387185-Prymnesium_polylepis.2